MLRVFAIMGLVSLLGLSRLPGQENWEIDRHNGPMGFRFGMTPAEAEKVLPLKRECTSPDGREQIYFVTKSLEVGGVQTSAVRLTFFDTMLVAVDVFLPDEEHVNRMRHVLEQLYGRSRQSNRWDSPLVIIDRVYREPSLTFESTPLREIYRDWKYAE